MGLRQPVARSTLAEANERRDWCLYADLAGMLIELARRRKAAIKLDTLPFSMQETLASWLRLCGLPPPPSVAMEGAFFVTRAKSNMRHRIAVSKPVAGDGPVWSD